MRRLVTADYHFNHTNILHFEEPRKRFQTIEAMNEFIIKKHNEQVKEDDIVYHVGDFFFKTSGHNYLEFYKRLNGRVILLNGNHDSKNNVKCDCDSLQLEFMNVKINMCHKPSDAKDDVDFNICGHCHSKGKYIAYDNKKIINVGLDAWNFNLLSLNQVVELYFKADWERIKGYTIL